MEALKVENLSFCYPNTKKHAIKDISFSVAHGEFVTLCGKSASGKTTLLRLLKPTVAPHGNKEGTVALGGKELYSLPMREQAEKIGFVWQSPDSRLVTDKVWHELAFGLENLGESNDVIRRRVAETASFFGIQEFFDKSVNELSGGQKQLLSLASVMVMQPEILILDEPTAQLDPIAAADFLACLSRINRELGTTVIISEHRLDDVLPLSDRVLALEGGELICNCPPREAGVELKERNNAYFSSLPSPMRIWSAVETGGAPCPVTVTQGREWLSGFAAENKFYELYEEDIPAPGDVAVSLKNIWFRYEKNSPDVIKNLSAEFRRGEIVSVLGGNGAGKSTLLSIINGSNKPYRRKVISNNELCLTLPQNPQLLLDGKTVKESLENVLKDRALSENEITKRLSYVTSLCGLQELSDRHPFDLSGGETQRAALAKLLLLKPGILLLDEPTKGLDAQFKAVLANILKTLAEQGVAVIMVSHDVEFCASCSHRCAMLFNGELTAQGTPREFFGSNMFYVTSARRMSKGIIPDAVTADEVIYCCTGKRTVSDVNTDIGLYDDDTSDDQNSSDTKPTMSLWQRIICLSGAILLLFGIAVNLDYLPFIASSALPLWLNALFIAVPSVMLLITLNTGEGENKQTIRKQKLPKRTKAAAAMVLFAVPVTIFAGSFYLSDQKYLFISLLVLFECMLPFFLIFEGRKPQARELVIIAVLCAITVAGRTAFLALPQVKPVIALVIISGIALGGESGFMVGAVGMLLSNIYFGQGAWTPWQMFAAGIIGFISGVLIKKNLLGKSRLFLSIYGFIVTVAVYGLIMNFSSLVLSHAPLTRESLIAYYAQGLPFDIVHGISTALVLFFFSKPMLEKLDRIKTKYGLYRS